MKIGIVTDLTSIPLKELMKDKYQRHLIGLPPFIITPYKKKEQKEPKIPPPMPFLGFALIGTILYENGYTDLSFLDFYAMPSKAKDILSAGDFDLLCISTTFMHMDKLIEHAKKCRETNPNAIIVAGGPLATNYKEEIIDKGIVDYIVIGEGDITLIDFVNALNDNKPIDSIHGIYSKKGFKPREFIKNIDTIPFPKWNLLNLDSYLPVLPIQTSRGCVGMCNYCREHKFWGKPIRLRSARSVVEEIKHNINSYGINTYRIVDSTFTAPAAHAKEICNLIIQEGLNIKWSCYARAENITSDLVELMSKAGCVAVDFGIESGSQKMLDRMNKNLSADKIKESITQFTKSGILVHANFIIGYPGETKETIAETIALIKQAKPTTFCLNPLAVVHGTELYNNREKYGIKGEFYDWVHETMDSLQAFKMVPEIYHKEFSHLKDSFYFFGGEHAASYYSSLGFDKNKIVNIYRTTNKFAVKSKKWLLMQYLLSFFNIGSIAFMKKVKKTMKKFTMQ